ncbi:hypothetical protein QFC21_004475 [Naganishia friedmannii]|uniref:Uncharacterized protein n=1 Tax=Naganishia friedmannii TaxID=89922 RepID=A0ACC2VH38_9TREE|nr:hypothetical protein QFC21_004475 [Naganishia friedmannii]
MQGPHPVDELSFYDQPGSDALFAAQSPSRHPFDSILNEGSSIRLRRSSSNSSLNSQCSTASAASTVSEAASTSSCSSIEQVFFGPLSEKEKKLVAKLGKTTTVTSVPSSGEEKRRGASSSRRLRKKDSLDFNRRKTLGFSSRKSDDSGTSRRWQGGLVEQSNTSTPGTPIRAVVDLESLAVSPKEPEEALSPNLSARTPCEATSPLPRALIILDISKDVHISASVSHNQQSEAETTGYCPSPTLADNFARMAVRQPSNMIVREAREDQDGTGQRSEIGIKLGARENAVAPASIAQADNFVLEDDANGDSDKENSTRGPHNVSVRSSRSLLGAISTRSNIGHVLQELSVSGANEKKSLRDRKGGRAERGSNRIEATNLASAASTPTPTSQPLLAEGMIEHHTEEVIAFSVKSLGTPSRRLDIDQKHPTPQQDSIQDEVATASARLQEVLQLEESDLVAPRSEHLESPRDGQIDNESFDPDSPLPMSRAPRHSLLLSLTTSPTKIREASPSRSSIESSSPAQDDLLFMPEYHIITTPSRNRPARSSPAASVSKTPMSQAIPRHRDSRTQRREQATLERQATITNKLSAVSLTMSGLGASAYGSSSTPHKAISGGQKLTAASHPASVSRLAAASAGNIAETVVVVDSRSTTLAIVHDVFDEPTKAKAPARPRSPPRHFEAVAESRVIQQTTVETVASRIPKSVAAPTQPGFRKPMISNLPVMKPSLSTIKSSTTQKPASSIAATLKAVRPETASQPEPAKFATPMRGRVPSALAFRSPGALRVVSDGSTAKPIQARTASGTLFSSTSGAARPVTPGKTLYRSIGNVDTAAMTPRHNDNPSTITIVSSTSTKPTVPTSSSANVVAVPEKLSAPTVPPAPTVITAQPHQIHHEARGLGSSGSSTDITESISKKAVHTKSHLLQGRATTEREPSQPDTAPAVSSLLQCSRNASTEAKRTAGGRAMRPMRPIASMPSAKPRQRSVQPTPKPKAAHISIISDKELSTLTKLNTARNEVYFCTLDRNVVKKDGPRPPSPNKVRTIAEREEEERKLGRGARAKRRGKGNSGGESSGLEDTDNQPLSLADLLPPLKHIRGAGEDEDYQTPARPLKRTRKSSVAHVGEDPSPSGPKRKKNRMALLNTQETQEEKFVTWDKGLVVIRPAQLSSPRHHREGELQEGLKSCLKRKEPASVLFLYTSFHPA